MISMEFFITSFIVYALLADKARTWIVNSPGKIRNVQPTFAVMFDMPKARVYCQIG